MVGALAFILIGLCMAYHGAVILHHWIFVHTSDLNLRAWYFILVAIGNIGCALLLCYAAGTIMGGS